MPDLRLLPSPVQINPSNPYGKDLFLLAELGDGMTNLVTTVTQPLVIAFDGQWGSGKSTFLKQWKCDLEEKRTDISVIYFDAFENDYLDDAFAALSREVVTIAEAKANSEISKEFKEKVVACGAVLLRGAVKLGLKAGVRAVTLNLINSDDMKDVRADLQEVFTDSAATIMDSLLQEPRRQRAEIEEFRRALTDLSGQMSGASNDSGRLIFIVDELDRCRPAFALAILERIKHFMSVPNVHFVLGVHLAQLYNSVRAEYGSGIDAPLYLQKFINVIVSIPTSAGSGLPGKQSTYVKHLVAQLATDGMTSKKIREVSEHLEIIAENKNLSLRSIERIFTSITLWAAFLRENQFHLPFAVASLCTIKAIEPDLFEKARKRTLTFEEIAPFLPMNEENSAQSKTKWMAKWWHFLLDRESPDDVKDYSNLMMQYNIMDRKDIIPIIISQIERLKI